MAERCALEIVRLGAQGDGIADTPGGIVYVPRTLPGERVVADVAGGRGHVVEVIRLSAERASPPCRHFGTCGGCVAQHLPGALYLDWKRSMVRTAFAHRGLEPAIEEVVVVPPGTRRRAIFAVVRRHGAATLGFSEEGTHTLVDIAACPVVVPAIERALPALRAISEALLSDGSDARLCATMTPDGLDVAITEGAPPRIEAVAQARIAQIAAVAGIVRVTAADNLVMQSAVPRLLLADAAVALPPAAFIQATAEAEAAIAGILIEAVGKTKCIADLFAGLGTFTFALARRTRVLAIDGDKPALEALATAAKATAGIRPVETRLRDLMREPLSRTELSEFDAVVLDPPRAGAKAQSEVLARAKVPVVCAVSCNPATLARDCRILVDAGYAIERVVPVDQFVWSSHVEAVAVLRRGRQVRRRAG